MGNFLNFLNEGKLSSSKFKEALKIKDYGFMIGTIADIIKTYILDEMKKANIDKKYLEYRLPGNHAEPGDKTLYYINYKTEQYTKGITTKINPESINSIIEIVNEFIKDITKNAPKKDKMYKEISSCVDIDEDSIHIKDNKIVLGMIGPMIKHFPSQSSGWKLMTDNEKFFKDNYCTPLAKKLKDYTVKCESGSSQIVMTKK